MSFLNEAHRRLKAPNDRREALLALEGVAVSAGGSMPIELAETWFELQDAMMEDPDGAARKLAEFEAALKGLLDSELAEIASLEETYDRAPSRAPLEAIARHLQTISYLNSLKCDLKKKAAVHV